MAKSKDYKSAMSQLSAKLDDEPIKTPIQEVRPVAPPQQQPKKESHVNFWVPEELMVRMKIKAAKSGKTIKQIGIEAFEQYLGNE